MALTKQNMVLIVAAAAYDRPGQLYGPCMERLAREKRWWKARGVLAAADGPQRVAGGILEPAGWCQASLCAPASMAVSPLTWEPAWE